MIDSHAHLDDERFQDDLEQVLERAWGAGLEKIIAVGYDLPSSRQAQNLSRTDDRIYAAAGIHPHEAESMGLDDLQTLEEILQDTRMVALGEIGLDFYYDHSPRERQIEVFRAQMEMAQRLDLPVIVHDRDAHEPTLQILREYPQVRGVLHCYTGSLEVAKLAMEMGYYISAAGPVTFANASRLRQVFAGIPLERLLIETDCPYLAPVPHRGKRNEPAFVAQVAEKIAEIHGVPLQEVIDHTTANTKKVFKLG